MANVLTDLAADIYVAADRVARELVGAITSVKVNSGTERVAKGDTVRSHFTRAATSVDITPSMTIPEGTDQTVDNKTMSITKSKAVQIPWTGEDMKSVNNGAGFSTIYGDQVMQAMRTITNEVEVDLMTEIYKNASRAVGTAGTTPFASNFDLIAQARQILVDNGCPVNDGNITMVLNTLAGTNIRNLAQLQKANENGSDEMLRQGTLLDLQGVRLKESAGVQLHTAGTGSGYLVDGALAVGTKVVDVDTGTGTILAGDIVTFAADTTNKYVANSALSGGTFSIAAPGAKVTIADDNAITLGAAYTANSVFHRDAVELAFRAPAQPEGGDAAVDAMTVQDPRSGLVFDIRAYKGFHKAMFSVEASWGVKAWKPEFIANILG
jgi:hypothetical protein